MARARGDAARGPVAGLVQATAKHLDHAAASPKRSGARASDALSRAKRLRGLKDAAPSYSYPAPNAAALPGGDPDPTQGHSLGAPFLASGALMAFGLAVFLAFRSYLLRGID